MNATKQLGGTSSASSAITKTQAPFVTSNKIPRTPTQQSTKPTAPPRGPLRPPRPPLEQIQVETRPELSATTQPNPQAQTYEGWNGMDKGLEKAIEMLGKQTTSGGPAKI